MYCHVASTVISRDILSHKSHTSKDSSQCAWLRADECSPLSKSSYHSVNKCVYEIVARGSLPSYRAVQSANKNTCTRVATNGPYLKGALYRIQILCRRYTLWSYPAGITKAEVSPSLYTPLSQHYRRVYSHHTKFYTVPLHSRTSKSIYRQNVSIWTISAEKN